MTDEQIKHMAQRFLAWRLPENFNPDAGISFQPEYNDGANRHEPTGTNLFDATQAEAMVRHMVEGLPLVAFEESEKVKAARVSRYRALDGRERAGVAVRTLRRLDRLPTQARELTVEEAMQIHDDDWSV